MRKVRVRLGSNGYEIQIGSGLLKQTGQYLKGMGFGDKIVIVTDSAVKSLICPHKVYHPLS